jgi:flavin reductase (DIM6/NTAB) family NADH-FMN oxidoreductase RutF/DNA-binding transcriptional LysR family regulator
LSTPPTGDATGDATLRHRFLEAMSHAACSVNVVTTDGSAGRHGVTVSAMVSVSADTPLPTLLVSIHHLSPVIDAILKNGVFCVNLLRDDQAHISDTFAGRSTARGTEKFNCAQWIALDSGAPRIVDPLVAFDCKVTASNRVGSHYVVFGSVLSTFIAERGTPLIYANRAYGVPAHFNGRRPPASRTDQPTLSLGCFQTFAPYVMPTLIAGMGKTHPEIPLTLIEAEQSALLNHLRRGEIDLALLYDFGLDPELHAEPLAELTPYVLLPEAHPLAQSGALSLKDLATEPLILLDIEPSRDYFISLFRAHSLEPVIGFRTTSVEVLRGLVGHGLGYSLLATKPANNLTYDGRALATRPLSHAVPSSRLVLAHLARRPLEHRAHAFVEHCRRFFRS